jgi:hypothetical protein
VAQKCGGSNVEGRGSFNHESIRRFTDFSKQERISLKLFRPCPIFPISTEQHDKKEIRVSKCLAAAPSFKSTIAARNMLLVAVDLLFSLSSSFLKASIAFLCNLLPSPSKHMWSIHNFFCLYQIWLCPSTRSRVTSLLKIFPVPSVPLPQELMILWAWNGDKFLSVGLAVICILKQGLQRNNAVSDSSL